VAHSWMQSACRRCSRYSRQPTLSHVASHGTTARDVDLCSGINTDIYFFLVVGRKVHGAVNCDSEAWYFVVYMAV
jgi:hypothetical protein